MKIGKIKILNHVIPMVMVALFCMVYLKTTTYTVDIHEQIMLQNGWDVEINGNHLENFVMDSDRFPLMNKGDVLVMGNKLPDELMHHPVLVFRTVHSDIDVMLDGESIYKYGQEQYDEGKMVGYGFHYITLDESDAGKELTIKMRVSENDAFSSLEVPYVADGDYVQRDFLVGNKIKLSFMLFLVMFGVVIIVVSFLFKDGLFNSKRLFYIGMFAITIGMWSLCTADLIRFFTYSLEIRNISEFISLYLAPMFVFAYFAEDIKKEEKYRWCIYVVLEGALVLFNIVALFCQVCNIAHLPAFLKLSHILMATAILALIIRYFYDVFNGRLHSTYIVRGFEILSVFVLIDLAIYNLKKYTKISLDDHYSSVIYIGVFIFIVCLIIDFCQDVIKTIYKQIEGEALANMAYTDELTGLSNRRKCEEIMDEIDKNLWDFTVIGFDLNNLKTINDSFGHDTGDDYIKAFGDILQGVFKDTSLVCRIGGDEFYVIIPRTDMLSKPVEKLLDEMKEKIKTVNSQNNDWILSVAYGVASYHDTNGSDIRSALKIADQRMYKCKQEMKDNVR